MPIYDPEKLLDQAAAENHRLRSEVERLKNHCAILTNTLDTIWQNQRNRATLISVLGSNIQDESKK